MPKLIYKTPGGISVTRQTSSIPFHKGLGPLMHKLDRYRGIYLSSGYEYPERYSRWDVASVCPPIEIVASGRDVEFNPLNARGEVLSKMLFHLLEQHPHWEEFGFVGAALRGRLKPLPALFPEEERSTASAIQNMSGALCQAAAAAITGSCIVRFGYSAVLFGNGGAALTAALLFIVLLGSASMRKQPAMISSIANTNIEA